MKVLLGFLGVALFLPVQQPSLAGSDCQKCTHGICSGNTETCSRAEKGHETCNEQTTGGQRGHGIVDLSRGIKRRTR